MASLVSCNINCIESNITHTLVYISSDCQFHQSYYRMIKTVGIMG